MPFGWEGDLSRLVPLDKEKHQKNAELWLNDPEITAWLKTGDFPLTTLEEGAYFDRNMQGGGDSVSFAVETLDGSHIGFSGIHRIDWRHGVGTTGTLIGRKDYWRKGYGGDSVRVRTRYAFETLGLRLLISEPMADNVASVRMLESAGYREVGRIPGRWWKRGAYRDQILMTIDRTR
jgi:RimJ/RimL family protein N-acetyltransferase